MSSKKSFSSETANRYALALYELAEENSELPIVEKNINELLDSIFKIYKNMLSCIFAHYRVFLRELK